MTPAMASILIIDDDKQFCGMLAEQVARTGHGASVAHTIAEGTEKVQQKAYDVVFLDVNLPDGSGLDSVARFQEGLVPPEIIIVTGFGDATGAELAMKSGVWDYIGKQSTLDSVKLSLSRAMQYRQGKQASVKRIALKSEIIGEAPALRSCLDLVAQATSTNASVLITGDTGTGKELFARTIHQNSARAERQFVVVDCTALPGTLIESMLLGHERGVFTGADKAHRGLVRDADGGTLFLDEVGELPAEAQKTFLRVLQEKRFRPLGASQEVSSDFRLVTATNRDLEAMVEAGQFRSDLLYRLRSLSIHLPPVRDRRRDIPLLAAHMVAHQCRLHVIDAKGIAADFKEALQAYDWPGNVRELASAIESAVVQALTEPVLYAMHLPTHIRVGVARAGFDVKAPASEQEMPSSAPGEALASFKGARERFEKHYLEELVANSEGSVDDARAASGLSRAHLYTLLNKHGLTLR